MKIFKNKNLKFLLIGVIIVLIFFLCAIDSKAENQFFDPISYDFKNNVLYAKDGSFEPDMYNIRNQSEYKGHYESLYSFENYDEGVESTDIDFIDLDYSERNIISTIVNEYKGHSKVLEINRSIEVNSDYKIVDLLNEQSYGTISFWYISNDTLNAKGGFYLLNEGITYDNDNIVCYMRFNQNKITFSYGGGTVYYENLYNNTWFYIEIVFDCSIDKISFKVNDDNVLADGFFFNYNDFDYIDTLMFLSVDRDLFKISIHYDAIDYSWSKQYYYHRNFIPKKEFTNQYEVDKYEFDYKFIDFEVNKHSWIENEYNGTTDDIGVSVEGGQSINRFIWISTPGYINTYENGIEFNDDSNEYIINITTHIYFNTLDEWCATILYIYSHNINSDYPIAIKFNQYTGKVSVYNIITKSYEYIGDFLVGVNYYISVYLNYYDDILIYKVNAVERIYVLDNGVEWNDLYGLDMIQMNNSMSSEGSLSLLKVYNFGIYENGKYFQSTLDNKEFGLMIYEIADTWNSLEYNLITLNSENDYRLYVSEVYVKFDVGYQLRNRGIQSEREIINIQDYGKLIFSYPLPCLVFMVFDNFSIPYEVKVEGISLVDNNGISSNAIYIYDNTYPNRYFFYCIDNKLYYNFSNSYKLGIETMTIVFDVKDVLLDKSFLFAYTSYITDDYNGLITLESYKYYEAFSISNDIKPINSVYNVSLEQEFTLTEIRIDIKTDILDLASGYTSGYIQNLNLYYDIPLTPDYDPISVLELDFLEAMIFIVIRLIFFLIPSLIFRTKFGNKSILPMWLLIGLILFISGLIPFWLFFIQIIAIGSMLMLNRSKEVD